MDKQIMKHGSRTGYIFYKMLQQRGGYEKFEMAELVMLATLHDIGAYKTDNVSDMIHFETKDFMPHSVYGFLFLKYLSPMEEKSKMLLYHHIDYNQMKDISYTYKDETAFLSLAEQVDIYKEALGDKFNFALFEKYQDVKYSKEALELFRKADEQYRLFDQLQSEAYETELDELMEYILFTNEEKRRYMEMLMYCLGLCSPNKVVDSVTSICISEELARRMYLEEKETEKLYYGALLHDIGMLAVPREMIEAKRALTTEEIKLMRTHVEISENILKNRLDQEVLNIATAHHERLNGSGYPKGLKEADMNISQEILQVADTITGLINERSYKPITSKEDVMLLLKKEVHERHFSKQVVDTMLLFYDDIMEKVKIESGQILLLHKKLERQYELVHAKYSKN
jgi:HD-GYP domain-containing protein (c-di-GMP phosphodiesterase class II)